MKFTDLIIIYLTCGAPFGVYFFIQQRENYLNTKLWQNSSKLWLKCLLVTLIWVPFAIKLLQKFVTKKLLFNKFAENEQKDSIAKQKIDFLLSEFSQILLEVKTEIPLFHLRETFERYVGLTLERNHSKETGTVSINEIFQITKHENPDLGTICLNRRNRLRLEQHQTLARKDFLRIIKAFIKCGVEKNKLSSLTTEFANLIGDLDLKDEIKKNFANSWQTEKVFHVTTSEDELWNPESHKQLIAKETNLNLQNLTVTATTLNPD
ncbi:MAG: hypothetical protein K1X72_25550 [Pyrinomonadaceae bacterium]|nr:hypothetical protein [Pyrinomonadaceae bacterium]